MQPDTRQTLIAFATLVVFVMLLVLPMILWG